MRRDGEAVGKLQLPCRGVQVEVVGTFSSHIPRHCIENGEATVLSRGGCETISDLALGGDGRTCTCSWLLDFFSNGWVTPLQSLVGSAFQTYLRLDFQPTEV